MLKNSELLEIDFESLAYKEFNLLELDYWMAYDGIIKFLESLPSKPIIIGHSMGGLIMQKLMESDKIKMNQFLDDRNWGSESGYPTNITAL